jgi:adenosylcobinamide kinase/adenosylcobinamide-phosphate guanylyltransferase
MKILVLGGARSGKSRHAESVAIDSGKSRLYIATAQALDEEMQQRIVHHQNNRDSLWNTFEIPISLGEALLQKSSPDNVIVVDCLTLWITNLLLAGGDIFTREKDNFLAILPTLPGDVILVSNETGLGIVPGDPLSRRFADEAGRLNQSVAALCEKVTLIVAGLPLTLKP